MNDAKLNRIKQVVENGYNLGTSNARYLLSVIDELWNNLDSAEAYIDEIKAHGTREERELRSALFDKERRIQQLKAKIGWLEEKLEAKITLANNGWEEERYALQEENERLRVRAAEMAAEDCAKMERLRKENNELKQMLNDYAPFGVDTDADLIEKTKRKTCPTCGGSGEDKDSMAEHLGICALCGGHGTIK